MLIVDRMGRNICGDGAAALTDGVTRGTNGRSRAMAGAVEGGHEAPDYLRCGTNLFRVTAIGQGNPTADLNDLLQVCGQSFSSPAIGLAVKRYAMSIEFLVTSLIVVATPGTGVLYTLAAGL